MAFGFMQSGPGQFVRGLFSGLEQANLATDSRRRQEELIRQVAGGDPELEIALRQNPAFSGQLELERRRPREVGPNTGIINSASDPTVAYSTPTFGFTPNGTPYTNDIFQGTGPQYGERAPLSEAELADIEDTRSNTRYRDTSTEYIPKTFDEERRQFDQGYALDTRRVDIDETLGMGQLDVARQNSATSRMNAGTSASSASRTSYNEVVGGIANKIATQGPQSLTPGEQFLWNQASGGGGGGGYAAPAPAPPPGGSYYDPQSGRIRTYGD